MLIAVSPAFANDTCNADSQAALESCIKDGVNSCQAQYSACSLLAATVDEARAAVAQRCMFRPDGSSRSAKSCVVCINRAIKDLRRGASVWMFPTFTASLRLELRDLQTECGQ